MNTTASISIPEAVAQYINAANRFDAPTAAECFTPDALVRDEQKEHVGRAAIQRWISQTSDASSPQVTVTRARSIGATVALVGQVTGNFAGSPVELEYEFRLQEGKIAQLTIQ